MADASETELESDLNNEEFGSGEDGSEDAEDEEEGKL